MLTLTADPQGLSFHERMAQRFDIAGNRLLTHVLFWLGYLFVYTGVHAEGENGLLSYFLDELQGLPAAMLVAYVNVYVLFPRFFVLKKYMAYAAWAVLLLFIASLLNRILIERIVEPNFFPGTTYYEPIFVWYLLFKGMPRCCCLRCLSEPLPIGSIRKEFIRIRSGKNLLPSCTC
jgi:hypothetical protein